MSKVSKAYYGVLTNRRQLISELRKAVSEVRGELSACPYVNDTEGFDSFCDFDEQSMAYDFHMSQAIDRLEWLVTRVGLLPLGINSDFPEEIEAGLQSVNKLIAELERGYH